MAVDREPEAHGATKRRLWVLAAETRCVLSTLGLLARHEVAMPRDNVGRSVVFADGTRSEVYRETAMRKRRYLGLVLLVVKFRLRFIGSSRLAHWLFRVESLFNTLLFAAHRGFQTKLWLTDRRTWFYRGIYEWEGMEAAVEYAETLRVVLRPWVQSGSFAYQIIEGRSRDDYLQGVEVEPSEQEEAWWRSMRSGAVSADELR